MDSEHRVGYEDQKGGQLRNPRRAEAKQRVAADKHKPDLEEELSRVIGDVAAHQVADFARGIRNWARGACSTMGGNIREYLQEESRELPTRFEVDRFSQQVGELRDDVERVAARLKRLESTS